MNTIKTTTQGTIQLNGSKSISNRVLIIQALAELNNQIASLSNAKDTTTLQRLLQQDTPIVDVGEAGTVCRFMTAYLACKASNKVLMGTPRMCDRPIGALVTALNELGADIGYIGKAGYPPLKFNGDINMQGGRVHISANVSSQFISALLMIAPLLHNGIELILEGKIVSRPYIQMTLNIMEEFGILSCWNGNLIKVPQQTYQAKDFIVEADWSAASYYYSIAGLSQSASLQLNGLYDNSVQGDAVIVDIMTQFGVTTTYNEKGVLLSKDGPSTITAFEHDFSDCPDIAQTFMVLCAALNIPAHLTGLETLTIKETDRLAAPKTELEKLGCQISITSDTFTIEKGIASFHQKVNIATYHDHRMAMAFAPLQLVLDDIVIQDPNVVNKSYPSFWADMKLLGITF